MVSSNNSAEQDVGVVDTARRARAASIELGVLSAEVRNSALDAIARALVQHREPILTANREDKKLAELEVAKGTMSTALLKRLDLEGQGKFDAVLQGLSEVKALPDPVGRVTYACRLDNGLDLYRVTAPIGVICMIFEARPDAAVQIASLTVKSANAVILKGGKEATHTNKALIDAIRAGLATVPGFPVDAVQLVIAREEIKTLLDLDRYIDLVIPRGSNKLVRFIQDNTRIPVLGHADGICAVYVDKAADGDMAAKVVRDSKIQYPAACNAAETLLIHRDVLHTVLPKVAEELVKSRVSLKADAESLAVLGPTAQPSQPEDYNTEFLDLVMAVKTVGSVEEAVAHINSHGSHHTDCIITGDKEAAKYFLARVDSASVFHNCSTRFADGQRFGFGAEVGISTNKTHARGPVGLDGLVIYKYRLYGSGQTVGEFSGPGAKSYVHAPIDQTLPQ